MTMIEIVEMACKNISKTNKPSRKSKNHKTPTVTTRIDNNLKCVLNKIDDEMTPFDRRYQEEHKGITNEISDRI